VEASEWMYQNIPYTSTIANEHWDDPLPLLLPGYLPFRNTQEIAVYTPDLLEDTSINYQKIQQMYTQLTDSDYIILSSARASGSIGELSKEFPLMSEYYPALDNGSIGFKLMHKSAQYPSLFGITIPDEAAEEAFWVYDHPTVRIYQKQSDVSLEEFTHIVCKICSNE
jgi:hypothetical protein